MKKMTVFSEIFTMGGHSHFTLQDIIKKMKDRGLQFFGVDFSLENMRDIQLEDLVSIDLECLVAWGICRSKRGVYSFTSFYANL